MHDINSDLDLSPLVGQMLQQACMGQWDFQFHFEGWSITGQGRVDVTLKGSTTTLFNGAWKDTSRLPELFGSKVESWRVTSKRSFEVLLEGGSILGFISESDQYEDFIINPPGWII